MGESIRLRSSTLSAELLIAGASLRSLHLAGHPSSLILGLEDHDLYGEANRAYFGATVGRNANRIGFGRLPVEGTVHRLSLNEPPHHLHGGATGASTRDWTVENVSETDAVLSLRLPDGSDGYPGRADLTATFALAEDTLTITFEAEVTAPSVVNLTSHLYFDLSGGHGAHDHRLTVAADNYLPVGDTLIPTGEVAPVEATPFDFRTAKPFRDGPSLLDHNLCLGRERVWTPRTVARLVSQTSGVAMELATTECGLQVYDGSYLKGEYTGQGGKPIQMHGGIAIEPQNWPDAPNHPDFPSGLLRPGERYRHESVYRFTAA